GEIEVAPEAPESGYRDGEVELALALEPTALRLGEHAGAQRARLRACQRRMIEHDQLAVNAEDRWTLGGDVQGGCGARDRLVQEGVRPAHSRPWSSGRARGGPPTRPAPPPPPPPA